MSIKCVLLLLLACSSTAFGQVLEPPVLYWSMDAVSGTELRPDRGNITLWSGDMKRWDEPYVTDGYDGEALLCTNRTVDLAVRNTEKSSECLFMPNLCSGLTVTMWIKVQHWTDLLSWIFWTGAYIFNYPGIAIYPDAHDRISLSAAVLMPNSDLYEASVSQDLIGLNQWAHVAVTWSEANGIKIYVNGTEAPAYTQIPQKRTQRVLSFGIILPLRFGQDEMSFHMDEVKVWYRELAPSEIPSTLNPGVEIATTTEVQTTTATTTVPPTTAATTTTTASTTITTTTIATTTAATTAPATTASTAAPIATTTAATSTAPTTTPAATTLTTPSQAVTSSAASSTTAMTSSTSATTQMTSSTAAATPKPPVTTARTSTTTTTTTTTTTSGQAPSSTETNPGFWTIPTIIAVSVGASLAVLALCIACIVCICLRRRQEEKRSKPTHV